jgi:chromate transporter
MGPDSQSGVPEVFWAFLRLGLTSFGGPVAHLGYFRDEFVGRRKWFSDQNYGDLVALCQMLPGPTSSQAGIGIGLAKAGLPGAFAAWIGFTLPSALLMTLFGLSVTQIGSGLDAGLLRGLMIVAVAVVARAIFGMARSLCPDPLRATFAILAAMAALAFPTSLGQMTVILLGAVAGMIFVRGVTGDDAATLGISVSHGVALGALVLFAAILLGLPLLYQAYPSHALALASSFFRSGSFVFGGGHVVLPLLQAEVVPQGWVGNDTFLAGYGAAQAVPGPLFAFAAYLGAVAQPEPNGWLGALICLAAIFAPSFLLVVGALPYWDRLRRVPPMRRALAGVNAAVVGLLLAVFYDPVWTSAIQSPKDFALGIAAFGLLVFWNLPAWLVVLLAAAAGTALSLAGLL